jgi:hypothetical protein
MKPVTVQDADISKMETTDHIEDSLGMVYTPMTNIGARNEIILG